MALVLRLVFGPLADRTGRYWTLTVVGYGLTAVCVPLLAVTPFIGGAGLAVAAVLILLERSGKAVRSPSKSALLAHVATAVGRGRGFGVHKALDQVGALAGPLLVAAVIAAAAGAIWPALAVLAIPGAAAMVLLAVLRSRVPDPSVYDETTESRDAAAPSDRRWRRAGPAGMVRRRRRRPPAARVLRLRARRGAHHRWARDLRHHRLPPDGVRARPGRRRAARVCRRDGCRGARGSRRSASSTTAAAPPSCMPCRCSSRSCPRWPCRVGSGSCSSASRSGRWPTACRTRPSRRSSRRSWRLRGARRHTASSPASREPSRSSAESGRAGSTSARSPRSSSSSRSPSSWPWPCSPGPSARCAPTTRRPV